MTDTTLDRLTTALGRSYLHPRLSPDGRRVVFEVAEERGADIWVADLALQTTERVTRDGVSDRPEWSPDGRRLLYSSARALPSALFEQPADGSGVSVKLVNGTGLGVHEGVYTPDGRWLAYVSNESGREEVYVRALARLSGSK